MKVPEVKSAPNAGGEIQLVNKPADVEMVFVDGMSGATVSSQVTKINFFQQIADPETKEGVFGRFRLSLVVPNEQFVQMAAILKRIADDISADAKTETESK